MFGPWDSERARRAALTLILIGVAIMVGDALTTNSPGRAGQIAHVAAPAFFATASLVLITAGRRLPALTYTALPLTGAVALCLLAVANADASAAAQLFFWLPLLYAATQLRAGGAYLTLGAVLVADAVLVYSQLPAGAATHDLCYAAVIFGATTFFLLRGEKAQQQLSDILRHQAAVDSLTGLVNRRVLDEAAHSALASAVDATGTALILVDIDNFKTINDTYGHPVGDQALTHISAIIAANTRKDSVLARIGGDELALLLPACPSEAAIRRAEQIVTAVNTNPLILDDGTPVPLTVSAGVAHAPADDHAELPDLYASADIGLYNAKRAGRNRVGLPDEVSESG